MSRRVPDLLAWVTLLALTGLCAGFLVDFSIRPYEDAAMLMRYAEHIAQGKGIVWNIGEPPMDGGTDFLFMMVVALAHRIGFTIETAVRLITILAHFGTVGLIYAGVRHLQGSRIGPAFLSAAYFAVGPGLFLSAAYFGTAFFALAIAAAWLLAQRVLLPGGRTVRAYVEFSGACLIAGLTRPEGVLISVFMLAAIGILLPGREFKRLTAVFGGIFLLLGGTYFMWRWHYFGHMLPNPFYKKGGGHLYLGALRDSLYNSLSLAVPFIPAYLLAIRSRESLRMGIAFLIPIVGTTGMWILLSGEMNFGGRFQYPVLVLCALSWYPLVRDLSKDLGWTFTSLTAMQRLSVSLAGAAVVISLFLRHVSDSRQITYSRDGRWDIGVILSRYADRGYTIATTEAGLLPLYSRWRAIDTWGLNDRWIARHGEVTPDYLARQKPDLIVWHGYFSPRHAPVPEHEKPWFRQVMTLKQYAEQHNFTLAAVFGTQPDDTHYYYVRSELPERDEIVQRIRSTNYFWYSSGRRCTNYADFESR